MMRLLLRWTVLWLVTGLLSVPLVFAQDATAGAPTLQVAKPAAADANVVVLAVVVRDKKGVLVNGLTKNDFALQVKGKTQDIGYVDHENDVPLTLGVAVDVRDSQQSKLEEERADTKGFLQAVLSPASGKRAADKGFVVHFAKEIELLQDVTDQRPLLDKAVDELGTTSASFHTVDAPDTVDSEGRKERHGGTSLYDAVYLSTEELMAKQKGRKVLVVLTDGVDVGSKESLTEVLESAQEANAVVYAVYTKGQQHFDQQMGNPNRRTSGGYPGGGYPGGGYPGGGYPGGGYPGGGYPGGGNRNPNGNGGPGGSSRKPSVDGRQVLDRICGETGGRVFEVSKKQTVAEIYAQIAEEVKAEYLLGFTPDAAGSRYGLHPIDLNMSNAEMNKKMDIETRSGYYGGPSE